MNVQHAHAIMGENMTTREAVERALACAYTDDQRAALARIQFSEAELVERKETHLLLPGYPFSINELRVAFPAAFFCGDVGREFVPWYRGEHFAGSERVHVRWYLIRMSEVPGSRGELFPVGQRLLKMYEEVPRACEMVYTALLYARLTGRLIFADWYGWCADIDSWGARVWVGGQRHGIQISSGSLPDYCSPKLGLTSQRV